MDLTSLQLPPRATKRDCHVSFVNLVWIRADCRRSATSCSINCATASSPPPWAPSPAPCGISDCSRRLRHVQRHRSFVLACSTPLNGPQPAPFEPASANCDVDTSATGACTIGSPAAAVPYASHPESPLRSLRWLSDTARPVRCPFLSVRYHASRRSIPLQAARMHRDGAQAVRAPVAQWIERPPPKR